MSISAKRKEHELEEYCTHLVTEAETAVGLTVWDGCVGTRIHWNTAIVHCHVITKGPFALDFQQAVVLFNTVLSKIPYPARMTAIQIHTPLDAEFEFDIELPSSVSDE